MKHSKAFTFTSVILAASFLFGVMTACQSQQQEQESETDISYRKSPIAISAVNHAATNTYIKVVYGQPYKRGRVIFGDLEAWGEIWRTGANEATEITFTNNVEMGDELIEAGTYALFTIPEPDSFTVILNNELGQWGAFEYDESQDYKRMKFPVKNIEDPVEAFTIDFSDPENNQTTMLLKWDVVRVDVPIRFVE